MSNSLNQLIKKKFNKIPKKKILSDKSRLKGGDIDILDTNCTIRNSFLNNKEFVQSIVHARHHKTGTRYDLIDNKGNLISLDFLNGKEKNPLFYNLSKKEGKKVNSKEINIEFTNLFTIMINLIKYFFWFLKKIFIQQPGIIEIFGIDGAGKSYLSKKIYQKLNKTVDIKFVHLWRIKKDKNSQSITPYQKKVYLFPLSFLKEIYILVRFIILILNIYIFSKRKNIYIFERSIYDIVIDPSRYCLSHNPVFIKMLHNLFFYNSIKVYLNISYKLSKKRKNEVDKIKYNYLTNKLDYLFKVRFKNSIKLFKKLL
jgi:hypothetical protein